MQNPSSASRPSRSPRTAWVAALAAAALLGLTSPTGHATVPEEAVETGVSYYLIATNHGNRGVTFEVNNNNDWALLTNDADSNGTAVVLESKDSGYTIRSTSSNWPGYDTWCSVDKGIKLGKADGCATAWKIVPGEDGFRLEDQSRRTVAHKTSGKAWLGPATEIYSGHAYTGFKLVKVA
ncbi:hypothetical protein [Kitasatospora sp. MBT66]|uniref:hypothetical protein n=1 Tax=Kitasatospora sp. MBT66 TaxID=1444769 RepID=UPI0005B86A4C|nr:hypothetical protein [Kitasatospora sp. MBT66]